VWKVWEAWKVWEGKSRETLESRRNNCTCIFLEVSAFPPNFFIPQTKKSGTFPQAKMLKSRYVSTF
ncbi:MAG: hypothetical protein O4749_02365, partial [Trichodesmium sp. St5_bin2_1]|nr:hypothetical protein [Trichodesmium sp. St5_bin2_1]